MSVVTVEGKRPDTATYEPFGPSASYHTANFNREARSDAEYLIAVYDPEGLSGKAGVTVGYKEEFTFIEYVTVPFDIVQTHIWEGQSIFLAIGGFLFTVFVGEYVIWRRLWRQNRETRSKTFLLTRLLVSFSGLLILGSGVNKVVQMVVSLTETGWTSAALVTLIFVLVPLVCAGWVLRESLQDELPKGIWGRVGFAVCGLLSLATWAGFVLGPVLLLAASVAPKGLLER
ncbi:MAG: hypothetical protein ABEK59_09650 [Halobacteria archaeon]